MIGHDFPYLDTKDLNLDWLLKNMKQLIQDWATYQSEMNQNFSDLNEAFDALKSWVETYFDELDVQQEINNKIDSMIESGELVEILQPYISSEVSDWLDEHITNPSSPPVDTSLTVSGAAADAKVTGDNIFRLNGTVNDIVNIKKLVAPEYTPHYSQYIHPSGSPGSQESELYSNYEYTVSEGEVYYIQLEGSWTYFPAVVFYNSDDEFLSKVDRSGDFSQVLTVPNGAASMRININRAHEHNILKYDFSMADYAKKPLSWSDQSATSYAVIGLIISNAAAMGNAIPATFETGNFTHATIPITYADQGRIKVTPSVFGYGVANVITFLDANYKMVGNRGYSEAGEITLSDLPSTTAYVVVNYDNVSSPKYKKGTPKTVEAYVDEVVSKDKQWKGKKIVWYGTSISACGYIGKTNPNAIPQKVGAILGAEIVNEAVGSSCVHAKRPSSISATNPYGFYGNFEKCSRCLTNSETEMQWIIDNASSAIWFDIVPTITDALRAQILANSYETKIDEYLTPETFPDAFIFEHGFNDAWNSKTDQDALYAEYGDTEIYSYRAGMDFLIKRILDYNPKAKIIMIGNYCKNTNDSVVNGYVPLMQDQVQQDWNLPMIKQWERLGWSPNKTIDPYGYWSGSGSSYTWVTDTETHEMTVLASWLPDGVHPHVDTSGKAVDKIVEEIALYLQSEVSLK